MHIILNASFETDNAEEVGEYILKYDEKSVCGKKTENQWSNSTHLRTHLSMLEGEWHSDIW